MTKTRLISSKYFLSICLLVLTITVIGSAESRSYSDQQLIPQYDLSINVNPEMRRIEVSGSVKLSATASPHEFIPLLLNENMKNFRVEVLEPASIAGTARVERKGKSGTKIVWGILASKPFPAGEPVSLQFSYDGAEKDGFVFSPGPEVFFAHGSISAWYPLADAGDSTGHLGRLRFQVPAKYMVIASGKATSTMEENAEGVFLFEVTKPAVFSFAAGKYILARRTENPSVAAYLMTPRQNIDQYLKACSQILDFLSSQFGKYRFDDFAIVEVPEEKAAFFGASTPGLIFVPKSFIDGRFDYSVIGHEMSHQWWGNLMSETGPKGDTLLSEGMAQFGSLLVVEHFEGADMANLYRLKGYPSNGEYNFKSCLGENIPVQSLYGYLMLSAAGKDRRLDSLKGSSLAHVMAVSKGFLTLDLLSRTVGRERFRKIMDEFTRRNSFRAIGWENFLQAIESGAGKDLKWFFAQWFERTGAPDWQIEWKQEKGRIYGVVTQAEPYYQATLEVQAVGDNQQSIIGTVEVRGARTEFTLPVKYSVRSVVLDPDFKVPHWTPEYKADAEKIKACTKN